jgi:hypothetical protein
MCRSLSWSNSFSRSFIVYFTSNNGKIQDEELQATIRAINRQIAEDFEPYWSFGATLRLDGRSGKQPDKQNLVDMRGDAVIYMWDEVDADDALGYHDRNFSGIPYGFVFTELSRKVGENWTVTLSHEALELIADPEANILVMGRHPDPSQKTDLYSIGMRCAMQCKHRLMKLTTWKCLILFCHFILLRAKNLLVAMISLAK